MTLKQSFEKIAAKVHEDLQKHQWEKAIIQIIRFDGAVRFEGQYQSAFDHLLKNIDVSFGFWEARAVHSIYKITTTEPPIHKNWNRAIFTLYPNNKFEIEYIWDQELQDDLDGRNNEITPIA